MAEEKKGGGKPDKKSEKPKGWNFNMVEGFIVLIFLLAIIGSVVPIIRGVLTSGNISFYGIKFSSISNFFSSSVWFFKGVGFAVAGLGAIGTSYFNKLGDAIWSVEKSKLYPANMDTLINSSSPSSSSVSIESVVQKWQQILVHSESVNPSDWRLCVIEADMILDELLDTLQLPGTTMGEKLKAVEKSDFTTIESAWEAHKIRNKIAHESGFMLNQRETRHTISLYEAVFKEFHLI